MLLQGTDDDKHDKNRLHLDLRTAELDREVERIVGLGPSLLTDHPVIEHRWRWHILADDAARLRATAGVGHRTTILTQAVCRNNVWAGTPIAKGGWRAGMRRGRRRR